MIAVKTPLDSLLDRCDPSLKSFSLASSKEKAQTLIQELLKELKENSWKEELVFGVHLACEEAVVNAIEHGNQSQESLLVRIEWRVSPESFWVSIKDDGKGFDPTSVPDPRSDDHITETHGRGLLLMRKFMDEVTFLDGGTRVEMEKRV